MANEWPTAKIGDVCLRVTKGTTPTTGGGAFSKSGIKFIKVEAITESGGFIPEKFAFIDAETDEKLARSRLIEDDILFTIAGTIGRVAQVTSAVLPANTNQAVAIVRPNRDAIYPRFLYYTLRDSNRIQLAQSKVVQSVQANFSLGELSAIELPLPSQTEQRAVAHILGTLDDRIELNRKQSETLEAMARTLFKAWFVDFEPVRAKMEGSWKRGQSLPGLPAHLYDLFPDRLVESEFGEIPEGWKLTSLAEFSSLNPESWTKRTRPREILYVDLSNTKWGRVESVTKYEAADAPSRAQRVLRPLDTIVGTVRPGNGSYALISDDNLTASTGFAVLRPLQREYSEFVYLAATGRENIERLSNLADGGAYPAVRPEIVSATQVPRTGEELINEFSRQVSSMLAGIAGNERSSRPLAQLRDTLLPKLISGELRVSDAERILREAEKA